MNTLYMMIGFPGSGKSTIAKEFSKEMGIPVVSSDEVRKDLTGSEENFDQEGRLWGNEIPARLNTELLMGDVVFDATNLEKQYRDALRSHLMPHSLVGIVVDTPFEECIARQENRERKVPLEVMKEMKDSYCSPSKEEFSEVYTIKNSEQLICLFQQNKDDIEGCR